MKDAKYMKRFGLSIVISAALAAGIFTGCASASESSAGSAASASSVAAVSSTSSTSAETTQATLSDTSASASESAASTSTSSNATTASITTGTVLDTSDMFSDRDLEQEADTSNAKAIAVADGQNASITEEGVYVISGNAKNCTITVEADDTAKVQLVLDGVSIENDGAPAIFVKSADKVFVTTASGSTNNLSVTGTFATTAEDNIDGVIYSKDDLTLNGKGTLTISSSANGIVGKDDVKVTGGTYEINASGHGIQGKDSIRVADGTFDIHATTDALHSKNDEDPEKGYIYIANGTFSLEAGSDGIGGTSAVQIDGGSFAIKSAEGIEGTYVQINDGTVNIEASDDGINATSKSTAYGVTLEINGGNIDINMGSGDTDALDANGDLFINGGTVNITAQFAFDFDGQGVLNGGIVTVNGEQVTEITNSMMGPGGGRGGMGGPGGMDDMSGGSDSFGGMGGKGSRGGMR